MKSQVLHTVWCNMSREAAGEIWNWSLLGVKGLNSNQDLQVISAQSEWTCVWCPRSARCCRRMRWRWVGGGSHGFRSRRPSAPPSGPWGFASRMWRDRCSASAKRGRPAGAAKWRNQSPTINQMVPFICVVFKPFTAKLENYTLPTF